MSEKIRLDNENEQNLPLNNNYYQGNDNENSTINKCYQCCSPMFFQRKRNLKRLWGLRVNQTTSANTIATSSISAQEQPPSLPPPSSQHYQHQPHQAQTSPQQQRRINHQSEQYYHHPMLHQQVKHHHQTSQKFPQHSTSCDCIIGTRRRSIEQNRCSNPFLTCCGDANGGDSSDANMLQSSALTAAANVPPATTTSLYQSFYALAKKLKETQIETLCQAVKRGAVYDGRTTNCVLVPRLQIDGLEPHVIACRLWRWHDLRHAIELKRIVSCPNEMDPVYVCCNPTHWYRICRTDSPPPPYSPFAMERLKPKDRATNVDRLRDHSIFPGSLSTDGEEKCSSGWCQLAYWEQSQRVGRLFPVEDPAVNIFAEQTRGDGLCLSTLAMQRLSTTPEVVLKARQKIGLGVTLSRESDGMWIYNRSSAPVFVHSPTLSDSDSGSLLVYRVPPGHCIRAFDHHKAAKESYTWPNSFSGNDYNGPVDNYSVRISFAKGWGPNYSRLEVISCPCWLEVLLSPCR